MSRLLLAAAVGGLLATERRSFLQAALSRPLVASTLLGLCFGQPAAGLLVGAPLELLFLGSAHLGAALSDHETLAACAVASASAAAMGATSVPAAVLALLLLVPLAPVGRRLDAAENHLHQRHSDRAVALVEAGRLEAALRHNGRSVWFPLATGAASTLVGSGVGLALAQLIPRLPARGLHALTVAYLFAAAACAAAGVRGARQARGTLWALLSAGAVVGVLLVGKVV